MKIIKRLGKIFDPSDYDLVSNGVGYAQSPQVLVRSDCLRIYFSTRSQDSDGKFVSHVAYVDMTHDLGAVLNVSEHQVLAPGALGCFDEHGIFPFHVMPVNNLVYAYTCGWSRRVSVSVETAVGLAVSEDHGDTFKRIGPGPIFAASLKEPFLVGDAFVRHYRSKFHMWYIFGKEWKSFSEENPPDRIYKIAQTTSPDGFQWVPGEGKQIIADVLGPEESQALPTVIELGGRFHMFFCYRESFDFRSANGRGYRLGYAISDDLITWHRKDETMSLNDSEEQWDSDMKCYPHVFEANDRCFLLYNGNEFGRRGFGAMELSP